MSDQDQNIINNISVELLTKLTSQLSDVQASNTAYRTVLHIILRHHPNLSEITEDFTGILDRIPPQDQEQADLILEKCREFLDVMTEELARRNKKETHRPSLRHKYFPPGFYSIFSAYLQELYY